MLNVGCRETGKATKVTPILHATCFISSTNCVVANQCQDD